MNNQRIKAIEKELKRTKGIGEITVTFVPRKIPAGETINTSEEAKNKKLDITETKPKDSE